MLIDVLFWILRSCESDFIAEYPDLVEPGNAMGFISDNGGQTYNRCHCQYLSQIQR